MVAFVEAFTETGRRTARTALCCGAADRTVDAVELRFPLVACITDGALEGTMRNGTFWWRCFGLYVERESDGPTYMLAWHRETKTALLGCSSDTSITIGQRRRLVGSFSTMPCARSCLTMQP